MASFSSLFQLQVLTEATLAQGKRLADGSRLLVGHRGVFGVSPFKLVAEPLRWPHQGDCQAPGGAVGGKQWHGI